MPFGSILIFVQHKHLLYPILHTYLERHRICAKAGQGEKREQKVERLQKGKVMPNPGKNLSLTFAGKEPARNATLASRLCRLVNSLSSVPVL